MVYISVVLTIISIVLAIVNEISHVVDLWKFKYRTIATCDMKIKCDDFKYQHAFCHLKLEKCFRSLFNLSHNQWRAQSNISFEFEVYHIDNEIQTSKTIVIYLKIKLLNVNESSHIISAISRQVQVFMQNSVHPATTNFQVFQRVSVACMY